MEKERDNFRHKTNLGQNFLVNKNILRRIIERSSIDKSDVILEIGPGQGVLTREILEEGCRQLHSIEVDKRLEPYLADLSKRDDFQLHWGDAVKFDYSSLDPVPKKVIANIPYHITTPLIWALLESLAPLGMTYLLLMVQKEAADRLTATPRTKERYPLGITIEAMGRAKTFMKVSPGSFKPAPKVDSALVEIEIDNLRDLANDNLWRTITRSGFTQRRKKLIKNLSTVNLGLSKEGLLEAVRETGLKETIRAEELTTEEWILLRDVIEKNRGEA